MFGSLRLGYWCLLIIVAVEFVIGTSLGTEPLASILGPGGLILMLPGWVLFPTLWFAALGIEVTRRQVDRPFTAIRRLASLHRYWLLRGALFVGLIFPLSRSFSSFKNAIPHIVPYFADPYFIAADRLLFGTDPWRITHALIGPLGTSIVDRVYFLWFPVMMVMTGYLCFTRNQTLQLRGLLTFVLSWFLLGNLLATLLSSAGPCFYERQFGDNQFRPLMDLLYRIDERHPLFAIRGMRFLLDPENGGRLGTGISAMPSMHVAIAFMVFLVSLEANRRIWVKCLAAVFTMTICVGSVHLGWHYAVDGLASMIGVAIIWVASGRFVDWLERQSKASEHALTRDAQPGSPPLQHSLNQRWPRFG